MNEILSLIAAIRHDLCSISVSVEGGARRLLHAVDGLDVLARSIQNAQSKVNPERSEPTNG